MRAAVQCLFSSNNPLSLSLSSFVKHFEVSRAKKEPHDRNFMKYISTPLFNNYYIRDLGFTPAPIKKDADPGISTTDQKAVMDRAKSILQGYDFVGITERMDESLVVFQMLLGLDTVDILYLKAKGHGRFDDGGYNQTCVYVQPAYVSPGMKAYFDSDKWKSRISGDTALYQAANASLDRTIEEVLGRDDFEVELYKYRKARELAQEKCQDTVVWPCDAGGKMNKRTPGCLWHDSACGFMCLDSVGETLNYSESLKYKSGPWTNPNTEKPKKDGEFGV